MGLGLVGAEVGYAVDEGSNWVENKIEGKTKEIMKELNDSDDNENKADVMQTIWVSSQIHNINGK